MPVYSFSSVPLCLDALMPLFAFMPRRLCAWILCLIIGLSFVSTASADPWSAGVAQTNITPMEDMWMGGYASRTRPATGKLTDLWVKALALDDGQGHRALLLTSDLIGIERELSLSIRRKIADRHSISPDSIVLNCSHTHSGPVVRGVLSPQQRLDKTQQDIVDRYADRLSDQIVDVAGKALGDLAPCRLTWAVGQCSFAVNRRENKEAEVPTLRDLGTLKGPVDHSVPVLHVIDRANKSFAIVFGYACHATVTRLYEWSGDYPGFAQMVVQQRYPEAVAMFWAGCGADQNPLPRRSPELARSYGQQLANAVTEVVDGPMEPVAGELSTSYKEIPIAFGQPLTLAETRAMLSSRRAKDVNWARLMLARRDQQKTLPEHYPYPVAVWQLGSGPTMIFLGGEVVVDYSLRLKAELTGSRTWVAGYSNDVMNYIPSRRVLREGGYEGRTGMFTYGRPAPWSPQVERTIITAVHRLVADDHSDRHSGVIQRTDPDDATGASAAVTVADGPLVHTGLVLPVDKRGAVLGRGDVRSQTRHLFQQLRRILAIAGSSLDQLVQLNVYVSTPENVKDVQIEMADSLGRAKPAATFVAGDLPGEGVLVSLDALAASRLPPSESVSYFTYADGFGGTAQTHAAILPPGERIYLSGWINRRAAPLPELVDETLRFQIKLLQQLGSSPDRVVRIRAFLNVREQQAAVRDSVSRVFQGQPQLPPLVYAPWGRAGVPEIEFVVAGRRGVERRGDAPRIEYYNTPDRPPSPVFSRATRVHANRYIYVSGIVAERAGDADAQIRSIFSQLQSTLTKTGSDMRHLLKATYWLAGRDAAQALRTVRRELYDPQRPPAASAFTAQSVGFKNRAANLDMIAIPKQESPGGGS